MPRIALLLAVFALSAAAPAAAQTRKNDAPAPTTGYGPGKKVINIDEDEEVEGSVFRPNGDVVVGKRRFVPPSLIEIRADFYAEMMKSAETF